MVKFISLAVVVVLTTASPALARKQHSAQTPAPITLASATAGYVNVESSGYGPPSPEQLSALQQKQQGVIESCRGSMSWDVFLDCVSRVAASTDFGPGTVVYTLSKKPPPREDVQ
ncbi:hypothetical protein BH11PAT2_BH11PAT2_05050 [soil metagenome]